MIDFLSRLLRFMALGLVALIGLGMALIFTFSTIIAVAILFLVARLRGRTFSVQDYWTNRQAQRKPIFPKRGARASAANPKRTSPMLKPATFADVSQARRRHLKPSEDICGAKRHCALKLPV